MIRFLASVVIGGFFLACSDTGSSFCLALVGVLLEPGSGRTPTKPKQKLEPVSEQAKKNPPITTEARNLITDQLKQLMETNPDKAKEIAASFIKEFKVPRVTGFITEARHGEFLSHAISKIADN